MRGARTAICNGNGGQPVDEDSLISGHSDLVLISLNLSAIPMESPGSIIVLDAGIKRSTASGACYGTASSAKISRYLHRAHISSPFNKRANQQYGSEIMKPKSQFSCNSKSSRLAMPPFGMSLAVLLSFACLATSCTDKESNTLLQFLAGLSSHDSGLPTSWQNGTDCCEWDGISCSPERTVTDVFLASRNLQGFISPSLANLTGLLRLNLSYNLLSGNLPMELVSSTSIIILDVSFNQLSGDLPDIPSSTPARPLQILNISSNLFTGGFPSTSWELMKDLAALNASNNSFIGQIPTVFCVSAPHFVVLQLSYNQFSGSIPPELGNCSMLTSLSAGNNNLSGTLPDELFSITLLEHLCFPNNQLEGSLHGISKLTNLVTLDLTGNQLHGSIPHSIGKLSRLEQVSLDHNNMSGELPSTMGNCTNLKSISLGGNRFGGELTRFNFSTLSNLKTLDLISNNFMGTIPESIYSCSNLIAVRLSHNKFSGQLSERIINLKSLSFLALVGNSFTNITSALHILRRIRNLTTLLLGYNFMHEALPDDIIDGFENLQVLTVNDCSLSGKIPPWISKLTNLEILALMNNQLTGTIPDWMSNLKFLFLIDLSNNSLTGELPITLTEIPMLKTNKVESKAFPLPLYSYRSLSLQYRNPNSFPEILNLGANYFTGAIPKEIGQLQALRSLNLSFNNLTGEIPQSICNLTNLQLLDLSGNHLTGSIPTRLNNLHFLSAFNISNNDLEGPIPNIGQLTTFPNSSFDGNPKLCGPMIPHHCGSTETTFSTEEAKQIDEKVIFGIAFGAFFCLGLLYDQIVLSRYFG